MVFHSCPDIIGFPRMQATPESINRFGELLGSINHIKIKDEYGIHYFMKIH